MHSTTLPQQRPTHLPTPAPHWTHTTLITVVDKIADRYRISRELAAVIVHHAGLGAKEDRR